MRRSSKTFGTLAAATSLALVGSGLALADTLNITQADVSVEPGRSTTFTIGLQATSDDGDVNGCNAGGSNDVTVSFSSSDTAKVPNPSSATITDCDNPDTAQIEGGATVTVSAASTAASGSDVTITATASGGKTVVRTRNGVTTTTNSTYTTDTVLVKVRASDPCASVNNPAAPVFTHSSANGAAGWHVGTAPSPVATSTTLGATIGYVTGTSTSYSADVPSLEEGTTSVTAKATHPTCSTKTSTTTHTFNVDTVNPTVSADQSNTTWSKQLSVESAGFTASDATSGIAIADELFSLTATEESTTNDGEVVPTSVTRDVVDGAGNKSTVSFSALIDRTKPVNAVTGVEDGGAYTLGSVPEVGCSTTDALSGEASQAAVGTNRSVGSVTTTCSGGTDNAGNAADDKSVTYTVTYASVSQILQPINLTAPRSAFKIGSTVPVKFKLEGASAGFSGATATFSRTFAGATTTTTELEAAPVTSPTAGTMFRYEDGIYVYNWSTKGLSAGDHTLTVTLDDGTKRTAVVSLRK